MKKLITLLIIISLFSCRTKKEVVYEKEYIIQNDTILKDKLVIKTEKVTDTLRIDVPCNEDGKINDFSRKIKTSGGFVNVYSKNGKLFADIEIKGTENKFENKEKISYIYKDKIIDRDVEVIKFRYPLWLILTLVGSILINLYLLKNRFS